MKLTWNYEDIAIFISIVSSVAGSAVANSKPGRLVANQLQKEGKHVFISCLVCKTLGGGKLNQTERKEHTNEKHHAFQSERNV